MTALLRLLMVAIIAAFIAPAAAHAVDYPATASLTGTATYAGLGVSGGAELYGEGDTLVQSVALDAGAYAFGGLLPGKYKLRITPNASPLIPQYFGGETQAAATEIVLAVGQARTQNVALIKGASVSGVVRRGGVPVEGAAVQVNGPLPPDRYRTTTNADGEYLIEGIRSGANLVEVTSKSSGSYGSGLANQATTNVALTAPNLAANTAVNLPVAATIVGTVSSDGQPVVGGDIGLYDADTGVGLVATPIGADGTFTAEPLKPGSYKIEYRPGGNALKGWFGGTSLATATAVTVTAGQTARADKTVRRGGRILGRVTAGGQPVAGALALVRNDVPVGTYIPYGAQGAYVAQALEPGSYKVSFQVTPGTNALERWNGGATSQAAAEGITVVAGEDVTFDQELPVGGTITGVVTDAQRVPLPGRAVWVGRGTSADAGAATDATGRYTATGLEPGTYWVEFGPQPGFAYTNTRGQAVKSGETTTVSRRLIAINVPAGTPVPSDPDPGEPWIDRPNWIDPLDIVPSPTPSPAAGATPTPKPGGPTPTAPLPLTYVGKGTAKTAVSASGKPTLKLRCTTPTPCKGTLVVYAKTKKKQRLASASFDIGAGKSKTLNLALTKTGKAAVTPRKKATRATVTVTLGGATTTFDVALTPTSKKAKKK